MPILFCIVLPFACSSSPQLKTEKDLAPKVIKHIEESEKKHSSKGRYSPCVPEQRKLYHEGTKAVYQFIRGFLAEIPKFRGRFGYDFRSQSQVMIFFGENFIQRVALLEKIAQCEPLFDEYLQERTKMLEEVDSLMKKYQIIE